MKRKRVWGFVKLIAGLVGFYIITTIILKSYNNSEFAKPVQTVIREQQIDPSAFFYSDELYIDTVGVGDVISRPLKKN